MTGLQEIQDEIYEAEASLHRLRYELATAQGERDTAWQHHQAMTASIQARVAFRIALSEADGQCYFDVSGQADAAIIRRSANA